MRRGIFGKWASAGAAAVLALAGLGPALAAEPLAAARRAELMNLLRHDCGSCHGLTMKGGLGPPLLPAVLAERGHEDVAETILSGLAGTPMPPWRGELSEAEAEWLARQLKQGLAE